jgi:hypothetical protein
MKAIRAAAGDLSLMGTMLKPDNETWREYCS